jgi:hypothetical protein
MGAKLLLETFHCISQTMRYLIFWVLALHFIKNQTVDLLKSHLTYFSFDLPKQGIFFE